MEIRRKLTLQFTLIVAIILVMAEIAIFQFSRVYWQEDFYNRLLAKARSVTMLVVDPNGIDSSLLRRIKQTNLASLPFEETIYYDYSGRRIFSTSDTMRIHPGPELLNRIRKEKLVETRQDNYSVIGIHYHTGNEQVLVVSGAVDVFGHRKLVTLLNILISVFVAAVVIAHISGRIYSQRALGPILKVITEVTEIDEKSLHLRVDEGNGQDEIARLATTFNQMLDRLEAAFKTQRHFIANASHELRTPLAYLMGRLEVSLQRERSKEEYQSTMLSILEDLKLLNSSADKLLLLAQSSSDSPDIPFHPLRVDEILWDARAKVLKSNREYRIQVAFTDPEEDPDSLRVKGNPMLLRTAFMNLVDNGCKYSVDQSVSISIEEMGGKILIRFTDHGIGIPGNELEMIFEPFFRSRMSAGKDGHGLGLALVRQIIRLHHGEVSVTSQIGKGSEFVINLPIWRE